MNGVLTQDKNFEAITGGYDQGTDYILDPDATSVWITVDNISVYIVRTDEGVSVDLYPKGRESDESLAGTWALNQEAATEEELAAGMSVPCVHEWHTPGGGKIPTYCWKCQVEKSLSSKRTTNRLR